MRLTRWTPLLSVFFLLGALVVRATPAGATFPGTDGRIAFGSDRYGGTGNIFTMKPDGSDVHQLTFLTAAEGHALFENWSADGTRLVFEEANPDFSLERIFVMNADGSNQHLLLSDPAYHHLFPSFSPDGSRVAFSRCRPDFEACAIYRVKSDGQGLTAITHFDVRHNVLDFQPEYSPNGKTIAFFSFNRGGVIAAIYLMGAHGSNVRQLTPASLQAGAPDWSPDGSRIVFDTNCCNPQHSAIWTMRADGTGLPEQLTFPGDDHDFVPAYAPAGDKIAFERDSPDFSTSSILVMNADGSNPLPIQADAFNPAWGPAP